MSVLESVWLGRVAYADALALQADLHDRRRQHEIPDTLVQLEHPNVFTIGRRGTRGDVLWDERMLRERDVDVFDADRGGMVTYHGPGQLVGYPIVDLGPAADLVGYLRDLERSLIGALAVYGIDAACVAGSSGVWVGDRKIGAVGVRVTRGVTKHGYALNVSPDLGYFGGIVPCGITDRGVTSMLELTGSAPAVETFAADVERSLAATLGREIVRRVRV